MGTDIFASKERRDVLDACRIKWKVDQDLNFYFDTESEKKKALAALKAALVL